MQGLKLIACQSLLASVKKGAQCADYSSPLEVREYWTWGSILVCGAKLRSFHFLEGPLGPNKSCNTISSASFVEASMVWPFTV